MPKLTLIVNNKPIASSTRVNSGLTVIQGGNCPSLASKLSKFMSKKTKPQSVKKVSKNSILLTIWNTSQFYLLDVMTVMLAIALTIAVFQRNMPEAVVTVIFIVVLCIIKPGYYEKFSQSNNTAYTPKHSS
jgi:hypothetical protein